MDQLKILELDINTKYQPHEIKKQFYKLSNKYHPDRFSNTFYPKEIKERYQNIIIAYKNICYNDKQNTNNKIPLDHNGLRFINKIDKKSTIVKELPNDFNSRFFDLINREDRENIKLYFDLGMTDSDIENQFNLLYPDQEIKNNNEIYNKNLKILKDIIKDRENDFNKLKPKKILNNENFNIQFTQNKNTNKLDLIKYEKPQNEKFYLHEIGLDNLYKINNTKFDLENKLPDNPNKLFLIDDSITVGKDIKLTKKEFDVKLNQLINERNKIK